MKNALRFIEFRVLPMVALAWSGQLISRALYSRRPDVLPPCLVTVVQCRCTGGRGRDEAGPNKSPRPVCQVKEFGLYQGDPLTVLR